MKAVFSDKIRIEYGVYLEPILSTASKHEGEKCGLSRSEYIRQALIEKLIRDDYPLSSITGKFNEFYKGMTSYG